MDEETKTVLEFYANKEHYQFNTDPFAAYDFVIMADKGLKARNLLFRLQGSVADMPDKR